MANLLRHMGHTIFDTGYKKSKMILWYILLITEFIHRLIRQKIIVAFINIFIEPFIDIVYYLPIFSNYSTIIKLIIINNYKLEAILNPLLEISDIA